jgi:hypothetical protein
MGKNDETRTDTRLPHAQHVDKMLLRNIVFLVDVAL